jgi:hypothetical protein
VIALGSYSIIHSLDEEWKKKMKKQLTIKGEKATAYSHSNTPQLAAGMETSPVTVVK